MGRQAEAGFALRSASWILNPPAWQFINCNVSPGYWERRLDLNEGVGRRGIDQRHVLSIGQTKTPAGRDHWSIGTAGPRCILMESSYGVRMVRQQRDIDVLILKYEGPKKPAKGAGNVGNLGSRMMGNQTFVLGENEPIASRWDGSHAEMLFITRRRRVGRFRVTDLPRHRRPYPVNATEAGLPRRPAGCIIAYAGGFCNGISIGQLPGWWRPPD